MTLDQRREHFHAVNHAEQVYVNAPLPVSLVVGTHGTTGSNAGIVADDVHFAEGCDCLQRGLTQRAARGDIAQYAFGADLAVLEFLHGTREGRLLNVGNHDLHAFAAERLCHAKTEATRPAGNERNLVP